MALMHLQYQIVPPDWDCAENMDMECRYLLLETPLSCNSPVTEPEQGARQNSPGSGVSVQSGVSTVTHPCHTLWHCVMCHDIVSHVMRVFVVGSEKPTVYHFTTERMSPPQQVWFVWSSQNIARPSRFFSRYSLKFNISNSQYLSVRFSTTIL